MLVPFGLNKQIPKELPKTKNRSIFLLSAPSTIDAATPTLSVIMCVHRAHPWLLEAIDSVLDQHDSDFEFLIAANACSDELWQQLQDHVGKDPRAQLFRSEIGQLSFNLNMLVDRASSDYVVRMDSDDVCDPQRIQKLRHAIAVSQPDIIGSFVSIIDEYGCTVGKMELPINGAEIVKALPRRTVFCHPSVAIRRQFLIEMRGYLGGFASEDTDLWLRAKRAGAKMQNLPEPLLRYRVHSTQSIGSRAGYPEVAGLWLREFFLSPSAFTGQGLAISLFKAIFASWLPGARRYKDRK
ncbi:glycosyltransferase family 2 protein [Rhizobium sp. Rhizsp42]|uniref:glycosyltransferase family 2 protein n=1 Tax=Rhizobium sp. Rhizsp42 TaxID=3243034 RepID=UPI0039B11B6E